MVLECNYIGLVCNNKVNVMSNCINLCTDTFSMILDLMSVNNYMTHLLTPWERCVMGGSCTTMHQGKW
jgi:hypothetical protein